MEYTYLSMDTQYTRLSLLIGEDKINLLGTKKVLIFGLGGVGGHVCDALARSGIKDFTIVDNDVVSESNINRQLIANTKTVGLTKVDVMESHLKSINPNIIVTKKKLFYLPEENNDINFNEYDYVIDAIDTVKSKIDIIVKCKQYNVPVISALGCGNRMDPTKIVVTDISKTEYDPLAKVLRQTLGKLGIKHTKVVYSLEQPMVVSKDKDHIGSSAFVPSVAGITIASEVIKDLLK